VAAWKADYEARKLAAAEEKVILARDYEHIAQEALIARKRSMEGAAEQKAPRKQSKTVCKASGRAWANDSLANTASRLLYSHWKPVILYYWQR
jgi:hypothetical protein